MQTFRYTQAEGTGIAFNEAIHNRYDSDSGHRSTRC